MFHRVSLVLRPQGTYLVGRRLSILSAPPGSPPILSSTASVYVESSIWFFDGETKEITGDLIVVGACVLWTCLALCYSSIHQPRWEQASNHLRLQHSKQPDILCWRSRCLERRACKHTVFRCGTSLTLHTRLRRSLNTNGE